jgi:23S rRNA pseudouridine1911/1915/1917 synthase
LGGYQFAALFILKVTIIKMDKNDFFTIYTETTSSTMDFAKDFIHKNKIQNQIIAFMSKNQTHGRGRGGTTWHTNSENSNLKNNNNVSKEIYYNNLLSAIENEADFTPITFFFPKNRIKIPLNWITSLIGCSIFDALKTTERFIQTIIPELSINSKKEIYIKWPNDIIFLKNDEKSNTKSYKKICGILTETSSSQKEIGDFYIGIGLNFFSHPNLENSGSFWESLFFLEQNKSVKKEINKKLKSQEFRKAVLNKFCSSLMQEILDYLSTSRAIDQIKTIVIARSLPIGTLLSVDKGSIIGTFLGLDDNSQLLLENHAPIISGEVEYKEVPLNINTKTKIKTTNYETPTIAIDFGNTNAHFSFNDFQNKSYNINIPYDILLNDYKNGLRKALNSLSTKFVQEKFKTIDLLYSTVIKSDKTQACLSNIKKYFQFLFPEISFNEIQVTEKDIFECIDLKGNIVAKNLGSDRALKFLFAYETAKEKKENIITFSFGTAVTCEGVSSDLSILENFIFPGIQMAFNAINYYTDLVPLFQANHELFSPKDKLWDQEVYVQRGIFLSTAACVITTLQMHSPCKCYFSGGNAESVLKVINEIFPNHNLNIEISLNVENEMLIKYKKNFLKNNQFLNQTSNIIPFQKKNLSSDIDLQPDKISDVLKTMLNARVKKLEDRTTAPRLEDFRKIGSLIENIVNGDRIDLYMANKFHFHNRDTWRTRILNGEVLVEHGAHNKNRKNPFLNKIKPTYKIKNFDQIWLFHPPEYEPDLIDKIDVIFDDGDVCIFSKPPNMVIHAAGIYGKNTFVNIAKKMGYAECSAVHRIDRETSGILTCARKPETRSLISQAFREGNIKKMYIAVTKGTRELPQYFKVKLPIGQPENSLIRLKLWVHGQFPQYAETWFYKIASYNDYNMFACFPQTGRTNQIRIHLAAIGQWIVGDKMYHKNEEVFIKFYEEGYSNWVHEQTLFPRHMLHNTAIMAQNINLQSLTKKPVICELYSDMMESEIVQNLLSKSKIPKTSVEQQQYFENIFLNTLNLDFTTFPEIQEEMGDEK